MITMPKLFTSDLLLTSNTDLLFYLKKHNYLYKLTENGKNIINYDKLDTTSTNFSKNGKYAIIINTLHSTTPPETVGHWAVLLLEISKNSRDCMLVDSLANSFKQNNPLSHKITQFCNVHKLNLHLWKTRTQKKNSTNCGFQIVFFLHRFSKYGLKGIYRLQKMLHQYSLFTREYYILKQAYKLCK